MIAIKPMIILNKMNTENSNRLKEEFGQFFCTNDMRKSLMYFGFECNDGWFNILYKLFASIKEFVEKNDIVDFEIVQVKEKFGGLRVYTDVSYNEIDAMITLAETEASKTCEDCGSIDNVTTAGKGWISTMCGSCRTAKALGAKQKV